MFLLSLFYFSHFFSLFLTLSLCHFVTLSLCHFVSFFFYSRCGRLGAGVEGGEREGGESDGGKAKLTRRGGVRGGGGGARVGVGDGGGE